MRGRPLWGVIRGRGEAAPRRSLRSAYDAALSCARLWGGHHVGTAGVGRRPAWLRAAGVAVAAAVGAAALHGLPQPLAAAPGRRGHALAGDGRVHAAAAGHRAGAGRGRGVVCAGGRAALCRAVADALLDRGRPGGVEPARPGRLRPVRPPGYGRGLCGRFPGDPKRPSRGGGGGGAADRRARRDPCGDGARPAADGQLAALRLW